MAGKQLEQVIIEDARITFRNFAGKEGQYNREGDRNFAVLLPDDVAEAMLADGWNIKTLRARDEGDTEQAYISVSVNFKGPRPPRVVMISSKGRTTLPEEMVEFLDWADIATVDLILNPYQWAVNGKTGVKAYLKSIFVTINEDALELKYNDIPEIGGTASRLLELESGGDILDGEVIND